jgi:hypothetical protein
VGRASITISIQTSILRLAGERGMVRQERLFLTQNTLPMFDRLLDTLDSIPGEISRRSISPFFYAGLATQYEDERITEDIRDNLPDRIKRLRSKKFDTWLSEREWIPVMLETASQPRRLMLKLDVNEGNIDDLENTSCEDIFAARERDYQDDYRRIPSLDELCSRYVEGRWMDMHQRESGTKMPID